MQQQQHEKDFQTMVQTQRFDERLGDVLSQATQEKMGWEIRGTTLNDSVEVILQNFMDSYPYLESPPLRVLMQNLRYELLS